MASVPIRPNACDQQLAAEGLSLPQDAIASLLHRLVRQFLSISGKACLGAAHPIVPQGLLTQGALVHAGQSPADTQERLDRYFSTQNTSGPSSYRRIDDPCSRARRFWKSYWQICDEQAQRSVTLEELHNQTRQVDWVTLSPAGPLEQQRLRPLRRRRNQKVFRS